MDRSYNGLPHGRMDGTNWDLQEMKWAQIDDAHGRLWDFTMWNWDIDEMNGFFECKNCAYEWYEMWMHHCTECGGAVKQI